MCLGISACSNSSPKTENKAKTNQPIICDTQNARAENMEVVVQQAFGTSKPGGGNSKNRRIY